MNPQQIRRQLRRIPFVPFRVHTSDGKTLDVKHPEMVLLTRSLLLGARPVKDPITEIPARFDEVSLLHTVRVEPLVAA
jgi:hypothetical protein